MATQNSIMIQNFEAAFADESMAHIQIPLLRQTGPRNANSPMTLLGPDIA